MTRTIGGQGLISCKNLFELKTMIRARIEGNVFENSWPCANGQHGVAIVMQAVSQNGQCAPCRVPRTRGDDPLEPRRKRA